MTTRTATPHDPSLNSHQISRLKPAIALLSFTHADSEDHEPHISKLAAGTPPDQIIALWAERICKELSSDL